MGVYGMTSFVEENDLITKFSLHNTKLVIDGNNLCHFLYYCEEIPTEFGGNYDHFSEVCDEFFRKLLKCNVQPIVVFDGGHPADGRKLKKLEKRNTWRISKCRRIVAGETGVPLIPIFACDVLRYALKRIEGAQQYTCGFEADRFIATLARHWNCPVLSTDGDFFIFDIPAGVIPLDVLVRKSWLVKEESNQIDCTIACNPLRKFLQPPLIPLLAPLLGHDSFDVKRFRQFAREQMYDRKKAKIRSIIEWLDEAGSVDAVIKSIAEFEMKPHAANRRQMRDESELKREVEDLMWKAVESYNTTNESIDFDSLFKQGDDVRVPGLMDVLHQQLQMLPCLVEKMDEPSVHTCACKLRQISYGIVLSARYTTTTETVHVTECCRDGEELKEYQVPVIWKVGHFEPRWSDNPDVNFDAKFAFMMTSLDAPSETFAAISPKIAFLLSIVRYWRMNVGCDVTPVHVRSLLLCMLYLGAFDEFHDNSTTVVPEDEAETFKEALKATKRKIDPIFDIRNIILVHRFSQFQACLRAASDLALLLKMSEILTDPAQVFSGSVVYSIFLKLSPKSDPDAFVSQLLPLPVFKIYQLAYSPVLQIRDESDRNMLAETYEDQQEANKIGGSSKKSNRPKSRKLFSSYCQANIGVIELAKRVAFHHFPTARGLGNIFNFLTPNYCRK